MGKKIARLVLIGCGVAGSFGAFTATLAQAPQMPDEIAAKTPLARANARKAFEIVFRACVETGLDYGSVSRKAQSMGWPLAAQSNPSELPIRGAKWRFDVVPSDPSGSKMTFELDYTSTDASSRCGLSFDQTWESSLAQVGILGFRRPPDEYPHEENPGSQKIERKWHLVDKNGKAFTITISTPAGKAFDLGVNRELVIETQP